MLKGDGLAKAVASVAVAVLMVVVGYRDDRLCLHLIIYKQGLGEFSLPQPQNLRCGHRGWLRRSRQTP